MTPGRRAAVVLAMALVGLLGIPTWPGTAAGELAQTPDAPAAGEGGVQAQQAPQDPQAPPDPFGRARALFDAGYEEQARQEAQRVLKSVDRPGPVPPELRQAKEPWWDSLSRSVLEAGQAVGTVLVILTVLAAAVILLLRAFPAKARTPLGRRLVGVVRLIREKTPGLRRIFLPQVFIPEVTNPSPDITFGSTMATMLSAELSVAGASLGSFERANALDTALDLPDVVSGAAPQLKALAPLLRWVMQRDRLTVAGQLHAPTETAVSLSMRISDGRGRILVSDTFSTDRAARSEDGKLAAEDCYALVPEAAAWAIYKLHELRPPRDGKPLVLVGTESWLSYAAFRKGLVHQGRRDYQRARVAYLTALDRDPSNVGALVNLALLDRRDITHFDRAIRRLELALATIRQSRLADGLPLYEDPLWYQATYLLAVNRIERFTATGGQDSVADISEARKDSAAVLRAIAQVALEDKRDTPDQCALLELVKREEPANLVLLAGIQLEAERMSMGPAAVDDPGPAGPGDRDRWRWLRDMDPERPPSHQQLVRLVHPLAELSYRAQYNLACYHARVGGQEHLALSYEHLCRALEIGGPLVKWAEVDPALQPLREHGYYGAECKSLIELYKAQPARSEALSGAGGI